MTTDHIVETTFEDDGERAYWECSCGRAGSCSALNVDLHSDRHIRESAGHRRDRYSG